MHFLCQNTESWKLSFRISMPEGPSADYLPTSVLRAQGVFGEHVAEC